MKTLTTLLLLSLTMLGFGQSDSSNHKKEVLSLQLGSKLFGSGDLVSIYLGGNYNKQFKKHFAYGLESSIAKNRYNDLPNYEIRPDTIDRSQYDNKVFNWKVSPYAQYIPLNTKVVDLFLQVGPQFGYYKQNGFDGGYTIVHNRNTGERWLRDITLNETDKIDGFYLAYDLGLGVNVDFKKYRISPNANVGYDTKGHSFADLGLEFGFILQ